MMKPQRLVPGLLFALALAGCASTSSTRTAGSDEPSLEGAQWRLVSAPGTRPGASLSGAGAATLRFEDGRFSLSGPCNRHTGAFERRGDQLQFGKEGGAVASTKKMCPPEIMQRETALLDAMAAPFTLSFAGSELRLSAIDASVWRFDRSDLPPAEGRERIVMVAGQRAPCTGVAPTLCLQVRTQPGAAWQLHHGEIEGFDWQVGVEYVIRVREVAVANPPADGSSLRWVLEEVLERSP